jgi:alpha-beta hydrolase superfamily lysophospholipase
MSIARLQLDLPPKPAPEPQTESSARERAAHLRAMPVQRLLDNGMEYSDAVALHALARDGIHWIEAAEWLGDCNVHRALAARNPLTARAAFRYASACYRFSQSAIASDTPRKLEIYRKLVDAFAQAAKLDMPPTEKLRVPYGGSFLEGWLLRPAGVEKAPVVITFGGADGWREAYYTGAQYLLERKVAVALVDAPGQGETRLFNRIYLDANLEAAFSAIVDALAGPAIGIWGNSLGGNFAARVAASESRIRACCVNGGPRRPVEITERFPRLLEKFAAMTGGKDVRSVFGKFDLDDAAHRIRCPLLIVHGVPDPVAPFADAQWLYEHAASARKELLVWEDGDHCIYNHAHEKHSAIADFFQEALRL